MFKTYYQLTKPGIIYGNIITTCGGFLLASKTHINFGLFVATIAGTSLIIASACVVNNYTDRNIDKLMDRTKKRAIASGMISGKTAAVYAAALGVLGVAVLALYVNVLTLCIGLVAYFVYVILYALAKRRTVHSTIVGSIAGAAPVMAGYCAVTNHINGGAIIVFLILVLWQMPHFYSIAMYRFSDYAAAKLPVLPVKKGMRTTRLQILSYIVGFSLANIALTVFGYTGFVYAIVMFSFGAAWLWIGLKRFNEANKQWGRRMFLFSLIVILSLSVMLAVGGRLA